MVDIHSHILYEIDDGSKSIDESIKIIEHAISNGINKIVLTPHYINESKYNANNITKQNKFNSLLDKIGDYNIDLYLGNEIYIDDDIISLLDKDVLTINNTKYILIEFSLNYKKDNIIDIIDEVLDEGLIPIIAHPERYTYLYDDINFYQELVNRGCLLQANIGSLFNKYGTTSKKILKKLLKMNLITCFGSDIHSSNSELYDYYQKIKRKLLRIVKDNERVNDLLNNNGIKIINNEDI